MYSTKCPHQGRSLVRFSNGVSAVFEGEGWAMVFPPNEVFSAQDVQDMALFLLDLDPAYTGEHMVVEW